jgi:hypothetical protein
MKRRILAAAGALGIGVALALTGPAAHGATLTCTNVADATTPPIGCGGDQLAYTAGGTVDLAVLGTGSSTGNYWNSPVGFAADSTSNAHEDFTVFAVDGSVTDGPGGLGEYVVMYTPDGVEQTTKYCLSVESLDNGPKGAARWNTVLRDCASNGDFTYGNGDTNNSVSSSRANAYQVWAPVSGPSGLIMVNESLSHGFKSGNTPYVLDERAWKPGQALAYPENDGLNQQSMIIGCTNPIKGLEALLPVGYYNCP